MPLSHFPDEPLVESLGAPQDEPLSSFPPGSRTPGRIRSYAGSGGTPLRYRVIEAEPCRHALVYLHGIESHGAWFLPAAGALRRFGCTTYLVDRRGSGLNRGAGRGDAASPGVLLDDVARFRRHLGDPEIVLVGLSWGGKLATAVALDRPERVKGLVLVTPGIKSRLRPTPAALARTLLGLLFSGGRNLVTLPIEAEMFSARPEILSFVRRDPWRLHEVTSRFLLSSFLLERRIERRAAELAMPILACFAGRDPIVDNDAVLKILRAAPRLRVRVHPNAIHSLQFDERESLVDEIRDFLGEEGDEGEAAS